MTGNAKISSEIQIRVATSESELIDVAQSSIARDSQWLSHDLRWLFVLRDGLRQVPYCVQATSEGRTVGVLPLMFVSSALFGRFLVSMPYLNSGGVKAVDVPAARALVDRAVQLADSLKVKRLELRHETELEHPALTDKLQSKVHMRLSLPTDGEELWRSLKAKVRNQIRKGDSQGFDVQWGTHELLGAFYDVFARNMRDLGTPVFSRRLFHSIVEHFSKEAEFCVVRLGAKPVAAALLIHGEGVTEVPSASSLRAYNSTNANMWMYWQLLLRAVERGQRMFDFGRSSQDSNTYRFKRQWGAEPHPSVWQYYVREGSIDAMRPENPKMQRAIRVWRRLPLFISNLAGPTVVRGIP